MATPAMSKRHGSRAAASANSSGNASGNVRTFADPRSKGTGNHGPARWANRNASVPFTQRKTAEPTKTAKKRTAFVPKIVQKTSTYPTAENQTKSTRTSLVNPSAIRQAAMTTPVAVIPLHRVSTPVWSGARSSMLIGAILYYSGIRGYKSEANKSTGVAKPTAFERGNLHDPVNP